MKKLAFFLVAFMVFCGTRVFSQENILPPRYVETPESQRFFAPLAPLALEPFQIQTILEAEPSEEKNLIIIVVNAGIYPAISTELASYVTDLQSDGYRVYLDEVSGGMPADLREHLQNRFGEGLAGAIFVGDLPVAWLEMLDDFYGRTEFPTDLYYMDLDGEWLDVDGDGLLDEHWGNTAPEIWLGRITVGSLSPLGDEVSLMKDYFRRNHEWRQNWPVYKNSQRRAMAYIDDDWQNFGPGIKNELEKIYSEEVDLFNDPEATITKDYGQRLEDGYEFITAWAHGNIGVNTFSPFIQGDPWYLEAVDILNIQPEGFFYNLFSCDNANFTGKYHRDDGFMTPYIGGAYLFFGSGLVVVGSTKPGGMAYPKAFYSALAEGKSFGEAFVEWWRNSGFSSGSLDFMRWNDGMTLLGNPTLRLREKPVISKAEFNPSVIITGTPGKKLKVKIIAIDSATEEAVSEAEVKFSGMVNPEQISQTTKKGKASLKLLAKNGQQTTGQLTIRIFKEGYTDWEKTYVIE